MTTFIHIKTHDDINQLAEDFNSADWVAFDTETNSLDWSHPTTEMIGMSFYFPHTDRAYYLAFAHGHGAVWRGGEPEGSWATKPKKLWYTQQLIDRANIRYPNLTSDVLDIVRQLWVSACNRAGFVAHNIKYDLHILARYDFPVPTRAYDTMIDLHLLLEDWRVKFKMPDGSEQFGNRQLKWQGEFWGLMDGKERQGEADLKAAADVVYHKLASFINTATDPKNPSNKITIDSKSTMWLLPPDAVAYYAALDTVLTWKLFLKVNGFLKDWGQEELSDRLNRVQTQVAFRMEENGFVLDRNELERQRSNAEQVCANVEQALFEMNGEPFNLNSQPQMLAFFAKLGVPLKSTSKEALDGVDSPVVDMIKRYRRAKKILTTYLTRWETPTGTVHPTFNIDGTVSGRWSSGGQAGNFQNIPDRGGYTLKRCLLPQEGHVFVAIDYGQLEARLAAYIAEVQLGFDNTMTELFLTGADMHAYTRDSAKVREVVWGGMSDEEILISQGYDLKEIDNPAQAVKKAARQIAKTMNFGLIYGGGKGMLSKLLKVDLDVAQELVMRWRGLFPAFMRANKHFQDLALTRRPSPTGRGSFLYVQQPITGMTRKFDRYATSASRKLPNGQWEKYNPREAQARKAFNNVVQGLGGLINSFSALSIVEAFPDVKPCAAIHDALELQVPADQLHIIPNILGIMCDWDVTPNLTVDWTASAENWHDLKAVTNFGAWVGSGGRFGY